MRAAIASSLPATASVEFTHGLGAADPIALATNDAGAIVAVNLNEITIVKPVEAGAAVNPTGQVKALSGLAISTKGIQATYGDDAFAIDEDSIISGGNILNGSAGAPADYDPDGFTDFGVSNGVALVGVRVARRAAAPPRAARAGSAEPPD